METMIKQKTKRQTAEQTTVTKNRSLVLLAVRRRTPKAGWGSCKSCNCSGFVDAGPGKSSCASCKHHYSQHR